MGCCGGQRLAQQQAAQEAGSQTAEVGCLIDSRHGHSKKNVDSDESQRAVAQIVENFTRNRLVIPGQQAEQGSVYAEDRPRCAGADNRRMPPNADKTAHQSGDDIEQQKSDVAKNPFDQKARVPQDPHVHGNVDDADVDKGRSQQTPPFSPQRHWAKVSAPEDQAFQGWLEQIYARNDHRNKHQDIDRDNRRSDEHTRREIEQRLLKVPGSI